MTLSIAHLQPIVSLIAGVLILMMPRLLYPDSLRIRKVACQASIFGFGLAV